jgi:hypothetical protein
MDDVNFKSDVLRKRETQVFSLNFQWKFGKDDNQPKQNRRRGGQEDNPSGGGDMGL